MKKKFIFSATLLSTLAAMAMGISCIKNNVEVKAAHAAVDENYTTINLLTDIGTYGSEWAVPWSSTWQGTAPSTYSGDHSVENSAITNLAVNSTLTFDDYVSGGGISINASDTSQVAIRNAKVTWELHDYSKYIDSVSWTLNGVDTSAYSPQHTLALYKNADASGDAYQTVDGNFANPITVYFEGDTTGAINAVSFVDDDKASGYSTYYLLKDNNFKYKLGDATDEQQEIFFSKAFVNEMTCDGVGSITNDVWSTFATRISTMSAVALDDLKTTNWKEIADEADPVRLALERYDYILEKYGKTDFLNRIGNGYTGNSRSFLGISNSENSTPMIVTISAVTIATIVFVGGFIAIKKRKQSEN